MNCDVNLPFGGASGSLSPFALVRCRANRNDDFFPHVEVRLDFLRAYQQMRS
jgi:hypothetical protein